MGSHMRITRMHSLWQLVCLLESSLQVLCCPGQPCHRPRPAAVYDVTSALTTALEICRSADLLAQCHQTLTTNAGATCCLQMAKATTRALRTVTEQKQCENSTCGAQQCKQHSADMPPASLLLKLFRRPLEQKLRGRFLWQPESGSPGCQRPLGHWHCWAQAWAPVQAATGCMSL